MLARVDALKLPLTRGRALDFGCGVGRATQALALHFDEVVGIDIAPSMIKLADQFNRHGEKCRHLVNDSKDLHLFPDDHFDFVFSTIVLQHMRPEYSTGYIQEFVRILRPGGVAVFQIPSERREAIQTSCTEPLPNEAFLAEIKVDRTALTVESSSRIVLPLKVRNTSPVQWPAFGDPDGRYQVKVGNHWLDKDCNLLLLDDGRAILPADLEPGGEVDLSLSVSTPPSSGRYFLEIDLVQEAVAWFREKGSPSVRLCVKVKENTRSFAKLRARSAEIVRKAKIVRKMVGGQPHMETYAVPENDVVRVVEGGAGKVVHVIDDHCAGQEWTSLRYFVTK